MTMTPTRAFTLGWLLGLLTLAGMVRGLGP